MKLCECGCGEPTTIPARSNASKGWVAGQPLRFVKGHNPRKRERYVVEDRGHDTPCWIWLLSGKNGYGWDNGEYAHRASYKRHVGAIPDKLELDHLCRVPSCINPAHLEAVSHAENVRRGLAGRLRVCAA